MDAGVFSLVNSVRLLRSLVIQPCEERAHSASHAGLLRGGSSRALRRTGGLTLTLSPRGLALALPVSSPPQAVGAGEAGQAERHPWLEVLSGFWTQYVSA